MHWSFSIEKDGVIVEEGNGYMLNDTPFTSLALATYAHSNQGGMVARISASVTRSLEYGQLKVSFTVSVACPQEERWMEYARKHSFAAAVHYLNQGFSAIAPGLPELPLPPTQ